MKVLQRPSETLQVMRTLEVSRSSWQPYNGTGEEGTLLSRLQISNCVLENRGGQAGPFSKYEQ